MPYCYQKKFKQSIDKLALKYEKCPGKDTSTPVIGCKSNNQFVAIFFCYQSLSRCAIDDKFEKFVLVRLFSLWLKNIIYCTSKG